MDVDQRVTDGGIGDALKGAHKYHAVAPGHVTASRSWHASEKSALLGENDSLQTPTRLLLSCSLAISDFPYALPHTLLVTT